MIAGAYTLFENATFAHERGARSFYEHFLWISTALGSFCCVVLYIMPAFLAIYGNLPRDFLITFILTCDSVLPVTSSPVYLLVVVETDGHQV